jgi:hypothetical protein
VVSFQYFLDFSIFVDGNADPLPVALQSSVHAIQTLNAQHDTRAALTESNVITPAVSDMCPVNALHNLWLILYTNYSLAAFYSLQFAE